MFGISLTTHKLKKIVINKIQSFYSIKSTKKSLAIDLRKYKKLHKETKLDILIITPGKNNEYLHDESGYDNFHKKYIAYITLNFNNLTVDSLLHELKHVYVDSCIYKNGGKPIKETNEVKKLYTKDFQNLLLKGKKDIPNIHEIIKYFYYSSKLEIPSFLENHYFDSTYIDYKKIIKNMMSYDFNKIDKKIWENEFLKLKKYDIPRFNNINNTDNFIDYCKFFFKKRGKYILKKIKKIDLNKEKQKIKEKKFYEDWSKKQLLENYKEHYLEYLKDIKEGSKILDVGGFGCNGLNTSIYLAKKGFDLDVVNIDEKVKKICDDFSIKFIQQDIFNFKSDKKYDVIILELFIENQIDIIENKLIEKLYKNLNKHGYILTFFVDETKDVPSNRLEETEEIIKKFKKIYCKNKPIESLYSKEFIGYDKNRPYMKWFKFENKIQ
jgi:hypothetical protein